MIIMLLLLTPPQPRPSHLVNLGYPAVIEWRENTPDNSVELCATVQPIRHRDTIRYHEFSVVQFYPEGKHHTEEHVFPNLAKATEWVEARCPTK